MDKSAFIKLIIAGVLIILLAVLIFVWRGSKQAPVAPAGSTSLNVQSSPFNENRTSVPASGSQLSAVTAPSKITTSKTIQSGIKLLTPQEGDKWAINKIHQIHWNKEAEVIGGIQLINAKSRELVGWILASTGIKQNSFSWDTRDVSLSRQAGVKTNLKTGNYRIKIVFDSRFAPIESASFSVAEENEQENLTPVVRFKNETITPSTVSAASGTKIIFVNNDSVKHGISSQTIPAFEIAANGGVYFLDTSKIPAGTHFYSSNVYSFRAPGTIIVK